MWTWCQAKATRSLPLLSGSLSTYWVAGQAALPLAPQELIISLHKSFEVQSACGLFSQELPGSFQTLQRCLMRWLHCFHSLALGSLSLSSSCFPISLSFLPRPICPSFPPSSSPLCSLLFPLPTRLALLSFSLPLGLSVFGAPGSRQRLSPGAAWPTPTPIRGEEEEEGWRTSGRRLRVAEHGFASPRTGPQGTQVGNPGAPGPGDCKEGPGCRCRGLPRPELGSCAEWVGCWGVRSGGGGGCGEEKGGAGGKRRCGRWWGQDARDLGRGRWREPGTNAWGPWVLHGRPPQSSKASWPPAAPPALGARGHSEGGCGPGAGWQLSQRRPGALGLSNFVGVRLRSSEPRRRMRGGGL